MTDELPTGRDRPRSRAPFMRLQAWRHSRPRSGTSAENVVARVMVIALTVIVAALGGVPSPAAMAAQTTTPTAEPPDRYAEPADITAPEPLVDQGFLDDVRERLAEAFRLDDFYAYRERRTDININPFGRLGTGDVELYEVYPSPTRGLTYRRLIATNDELMSAAHLTRQDRDYHKRTADVRRRLAKEAAERLQETPAEQAKSEIRRAEQLERSRERARAQIDDVINAMQFSVERREMFENRSSIVVTFGPRPGADPQTRRGDLARKFAGTAWIDEAEREVSYVEAISVDSISFGLGLAARISDGAVARMRREKVADGVWMLTNVTLTGRGRAILFLRGLSIDYSVQWFDYRPAGEVPIPGTPWRLLSEEPRIRVGTSNWTRRSTDEFAY